MLTPNKADIAEIASALGYSKSSAFVRAFRRLSGETPTAYPKRNTEVGD